MAISYVGGVTGGRAGSTSTTTQSLSGKLTGGSDTSPSAGDLVVVWVSAAGNSSYKPTSQTVSGNKSGSYTYETFQSSADTYYSLSQLNYKIQGATVDTSLTIPASGHARCAQRWVVHVFRGVRSADILDVSAVPKTGIDTGRPNPDPITPSTSGAWIAAYYASATATTGTAYTAASGLSGWLGGTSNDTYACMQGGGYYSSWTSGAYDPAAITAGGTTGSGDAWTAMTIALRPEHAPTVALGTPADNASISDSTPDLKFTGTDGDSDTLDYQVQVDTVNTFNSQTPTYTFGPEDFESGDRGDFDSAYTNSGSVSYDSSSKIAGTYSLKCTTTGAGSAALDEAITGTTEVWVQIKFFMPSTFSWGSATYAGILGLIGASTTTALNIEYWGAPELVIYDSTAGWADTGISLALNTIHTIQVRVKRGASSTGAIDIWHNNTTEGSPDYSSGGITTGTDNITTVRAGNTYADAAVDNLFYDDVIINNDFITTGGGAPLIDALSTDHTGFSAGASHPTASGAEQTYTVQTTLSDGTYYWRVRAIDPSGGNTYGAWSPGDSTLGYDHFHLTGATPIAPQDVSHTLNIDNTTITQNHVLTMQDIGHGLYIDGTTIAQNHAITPQDIQHGLNIDTTTTQLNFSLEMQDLSHGLAIDNTTISQNHVIPVDDIAFGIIEDNGGITQNHIINGDDISLGIVTDIASISQLHVLSASDISHQLSVDATAIQQNHVVAVDDVAIGTSIDDSGLSQNHVIPADDISFGLSEDETTIIEDAPQEVVLYVSDISHSLVADTATITQNHVIAVDDISFGIQEDGGSIVQNHILSVSDISHGLSIDSNAISQNHSIAVDDISFGLTEDNGGITQNHVIITTDITHGVSISGTTISQNHVISPQDIEFGVSEDNAEISIVISPDDLEIGLMEDIITIEQQHVLSTAGLAFGTTPRQFWFDTSGNVYIVVNNAAGILEKV